MKCNRIANDLDCDLLNDYPKNAKIFSKTLITGKNKEENCSSFDSYHKNYSTNNDTDERNIAEKEMNHLHEIIDSGFRPDSLDFESGKDLYSNNQISEISNDINITNINSIQISENSNDINITSINTIQISENSNEELNQRIIYDIQHEIIINEIKSNYPISEILNDIKNLEKTKKTNLLDSVCLLQFQTIKENFNASSNSNKLIYLHQIKKEECESNHLKENAKYPSLKRHKFQVINDDKFRHFQKVFFRSFTVWIIDDLNKNIKGILNEEFASFPEIEKGKYSIENAKEKSDKILRTILNFDNKNELLIRKIDNFSKIFANNGEINKIKSLLDETYLETFRRFRREFILENYYDRFTRHEKFKVNSQLYKDTMIRVIDYYETSMSNDY